MWAQMFLTLFMFLKKGEMVMQTVLDMNDHHVTGVLVDENDQKFAVSVGYLEEGFRKVRDKIYYDLFASFIDFRTPDTEEGGQIYLSAKIKKRKGRSFPKMKTNSFSKDMAVRKVWTSQKIYL